jgi:hypothetical protein
VGSEPFAKFYTLLLFSTGYKSVDLIRSAWKRFVLIVQPLQFHYSAALAVVHGLGRIMTGAPPSESVTVKPDNPLFPLRAETWSLLETSTK